MSDVKSITLRDLSVELGMKCERLFESYSLPIVVKANVKLKQHAQYDYNLMLKIVDLYLRDVVKPEFVNKLIDQGVVFKQCEIIESKIAEMINEIRLTGDTSLYSDIAKIIYKDSDRIAADYDLWGRDYFAKKIVKEKSISKNSALYVVNKIIERSGLQPIAYSKKLSPLYDSAEFSKAYIEWENRKNQ